MRRLRQQQGLTQVQMAERLGISPSYLNLIEHNQRPLTLPLLLKLSRIFAIDLQSFSDDDEARLLAAVSEAFSDALLADHSVDAEDARDMVAASPDAAQAFLAIYDAYKSARDTAANLGEQLSGDPLLSASSHELRTLLTSIRSFAEILHDNADLGGSDRRRFLGILVQESERLTVLVDRALALADDGPAGDGADARPAAEEVADLIDAHGNHFPEIEDAAAALGETRQTLGSVSFETLRDILRDRFGVAVEIATDDGAGAPNDAAGPDRLVLSEMLPPASRSFRLARHIGLLTCKPVFQRILDQTRIRRPEAQALARDVLANYFASAVMMPYETVLEAARALRYDVERLQRRFACSFEQVCHRLSTLQRPGAAGLPVHFLRVDVAGNISKRFSGSGLRIPRYGGLCPRWNVHAAFMNPGRTDVQLTRMPDGAGYVTAARIVDKPGVGHHAPRSHFAVAIGCDTAYASQFVYADAFDLEREEAFTPVGTTCRLCQRHDCGQRAQAPLSLRRSAGASAAMGGA